MAIDSRKRSDDSAEIPRPRKVEPDAPAETAVISHDVALDPSPVMTVDELAELLRVDRKTAYSAIAQGEIPGVRRIGRTIRISRDTVLIWLGEGRVSRSRRK
jgi:excisionase family DNA binding protein